MLGRGRIGKFLEDLARPYVVRDRLGESYARMAADADREAEAQEWADSDRAGCGVIAGRQ